MSLRQEGGTQPISRCDHHRAARGSMERDGAYDEERRRKRAREIEEEGGETEREHKYRKIHIARAGPQVMERIWTREREPG